MSDWLNAELRATRDKLTNILCGMAGFYFTQRHRTFSLRKHIDDEMEAQCSRITNHGMIIDYDRYNASDTIRS